MLDAVFDLLSSARRAPASTAGPGRVRRSTPHLSKYRAGSMGTAALSPGARRSENQDVAAELRKLSWESPAPQESRPIRIPERLRQGHQERAERRAHNERRALRAGVRSRSHSSDSTEDDKYAVPTPRRRGASHVQHVAIETGDGVVLVDCMNCGASFPVVRRCGSGLAQSPTLCSGECAQSSLARQSFQLRPNLREVPLDKASRYHRYHHTHLEVDAAHQPQQTQAPPRPALSSSSASTTSRVGSN